MPFEEEHLSPGGQVARAVGDDLRGQIQLESLNAPRKLTRRPELERDDRDLWVPISVIGVSRELSRSMRGANGKCSRIR